MKLKSFEEEFALRNPDRTQILRYMREALETDEVKWKDLNTRNITEIRDHICETVAGNSACTYLAILKAFLDIYKDDGVIPCKDFIRYLKSRRVPSEQVVLSAEEIDRIEKYVPQSEHEQWVKAQFLCEYYCMARTSDIQDISEENIEDGFINYVSKKTKTQTSVPLHRNFLKYLSQRGETLKRASYNRIIKRICKNVGITQDVKLFYHGKYIKKPKYEFVGSHTARRSAASELARRNVPIATISQLMNHNGHITTTQRYIFADTRNLNENAMSFFN